MKLYYEIQKEKKTSIILIYNWLFHYENNILNY